MHYCISVHLEYRDKPGGNCGVVGSKNKYSATPLLLLVLMEDLINGKQLKNYQYLSTSSERTIDREKCEHSPSLFRGKLGVPGGE